MEEKASLQISMIQRSREVLFDFVLSSCLFDFGLWQQENLGKLYFWGKIMGETNDYLIAFALVPTFGFPSKKFFYWLDFYYH